MMGQRLRLPFWLRAVFLALFVSIFAGCATHTVSRDPLKTPPTASESIVALSITGNTAQVAGFDSVTVQRKGQPEQGIKAYYELKQVVRGLSRDTSLFIGVLPEGEYEFVSMSNQAANQILRIGDSMKAMIGSFRVAAGGSTDLGRLVMTPINFNVIVGRSAKVPGNLPMMRRFAPEQAALFREPVAQGWLTGRHASDRVEEYALHRPVGANLPTELPDGRIVAASRLGTALLRSKEGRWSAIRSERLESLMGVMQTDRPDAEFIAVGEFNTLLRVPRDGKAFVPMDTGNMPPGNLIFIDGNDQTGWVVALQSADQVRILRSAKLEAGQWEVLRSESVAFDFWSGLNALWVWRVPGGLTYAVSKGDIWHLDYASGQWSRQAAPNGSRLVVITANPDGSLGALTSPGGGFAGIFASMYLSRDQGATWKEIPSPFKVKVRPPYALKSGSLLLPGGVFGDAELQISKDDGATWAKHADFKLDGFIHPMPSGLVLNLSSGQYGVFTIQSSQDEGKTWKTEYSNFDREAYDRQQSRK